ncbi:MAG: ubiquinol-cytochrome C chaperone family protein [Solirubrobacterales bacterium]
MPFRRFFDRRRRARLAYTIYRAAVERAREPYFYAALNVPDSVDGRFDMVVLHAFLLLRRLGRVEGQGADEAKALAQTLFDLMFADMDQNLREMGVSDLAVGRKVRQMAEAFYGRIAAYDKAIAEGEQALADALARNLYRSAAEARTEDALAMAGYLLAQDAHLAAAGTEPLLAGTIAFAPLEAPQ